MLGEIERSNSSVSSFLMCGFLRKEEVVCRKERELRKDPQETGTGEVVESKMPAVETGIWTLSTHPAGESGPWSHGI